MSTRWVHRYDGETCDRPDGDPDRRICEHGARVQEVYVDEAVTS